MANERITENLTRDRLRALAYFDIDNQIKVDEQKSGIDAVTRLLKQASKAGGGGRGAPEFIISNSDDPDFLIVIECKAEVKDHASPTALIDLDPPEGEVDTVRIRRLTRYAVDGVLHYASYLAKEFNVIAVAISGQTASSLRVDTFLVAKDIRGKPKARRLLTKAGMPISDLIPWSDYIEHATFDPTVQALRLEELMAFSHELHDFMRDDVKASESEKPLFVSGTLIALRDDAFASSFNLYSPSDLPAEWLRVIKKEMERAELPNSKRSTMIQPYAAIAAHPEISKTHKKYPRGVLNELIRRLNEKVWPFISVYHDFDVVGQFYGEFLKYTGGDKKALGIVLTPRHITELFAMLANVNKNSKVLDMCAGTGGFLISAMHQMMKTATSEEERQSIRRDRLIGVEQMPNMFTLAASNMILRGDGKANLHQSSCFDEAVTESIKALQCDVGLLNPPYSQRDEDLHEFHFIRHMLECLKVGGTGVVIVPMSLAVGNHPLKKDILAAHTLEAVMSLPDELFSPVGTIPCAMVFTANIPHAVSNRKTWFGFWKVDGFTKTKHRGRVDGSGAWADIRTYWVESFRNREVHAGESVMRAVGPDDEWCAEAYLDTDYSKLAREDFENSVRNFAMHKLLASGGVNSDPIELVSWSEFRLDSLFDIRKGKRLTKAAIQPGKTPFVSAIDNSNGIRQRISAKPVHPANVLTVNYNGNGVAEAFLQIEPFFASDDVNVLYPKFEMTPAIALFICTIIRQEKFRFSYGRKWNLERMKESVIRLPATVEGDLDRTSIEKFMKSMSFAGAAFGNLEHVTENQ